MLPFPAFLDTAHKLANAAGAVTLRYFREHGDTEHKGSASFDPVTIADREAEAVMRDIIAKFCPDHGVIGEEFGDIDPDAEFVWVLDPIDGTRAYILGLPLWGTLIGLLHHGRPILGVMDQPFTNERFWNDEKASWYRSPRSGLIRCKTRACPEVRAAFLTASSPDMFEPDDAVRFDALASRVRMRRYGGDCYAYCMLALGQIDIVAEAGLKQFDIAPLIPIIEKAGGVVRAWDGGDASAGGRCFACGDQSLADGVQAALKL